jgi:hypothetical protein
MRGALITLLPVAVALLACGYDNESETGGGYAGAGGSSSTRIERASIDTGQALTTEPGRGVGALVEYQGGGIWHIHVACDTAISGNRCSWDIQVQPLDGARIRNVTGDQVETSEDDFGWDRDRGDLGELVALTGNDTDGIFVEIDPGAGLRVDVFLDDAPANAFVYWIGDGAMHRGAPTNPIDLVPTEP